jgi:hypothetical protein
MARTSSHAAQTPGATLTAGWLVFAGLLTDSLGPKPEQPDRELQGWRGWFAGYRKRRAERLARPRVLWGREYRDLGQDCDGLRASPLSQDALTRHELLRLGHRWN